MIKRFQVGSRMSQAVSYNGFVYIAGQVAEDRSANLETQTRSVLQKIEDLLAEAGTDKSKILAIDVFLPAIADFDKMNSVYDAWIDPKNPPARACVEARLADPMILVEMTAVAAV
ncbi:RidA family protein [Kiloniella majae]|uniref:RidA family protein n=1 Tax=Kiloniella majae TaxID=1938558 RepID=UPI000A27878D|nr:RidA family protein [Kiloniella majae]